MIVVVVIKPLVVVVVIVVVIVIVRAARYWKKLRYIYCDMKKIQEFSPDDLNCSIWKALIILQ